MHRTRRASMSTVLLLVLAISAGSQQVDDARRYGSATCTTGAGCAPAGVPRLGDGSSPLAVAAVAARLAVDQFETHRRNHGHSSARDGMDPAVVVQHALDGVRAQAATADRRAADPIIRAAVRGAESSPVRGPPRRS